jgi:hypothetical protein
MTTAVVDIVLNGVEQDACDACRRAKGDVLLGEERLRRAREAGALLLMIGRSPGIRTSSTG